MPHFTERYLLFGLNLLTRHAVLEKPVKSRGRVSRVPTISGTNIICLMVVPNGKGPVCWPLSNVTTPAY